MAPERFRGEGDARADVYALGLTLYELLTLRPAFDSPDRLRLIEQIKTEEPPRPRSLDPRIPRDLETIVLKAIEKDPSGRYPTADALAEDLRRFLADEPIQARPDGACGAGMEMEPQESPGGVPGRGVAAMMMVVVAATSCPPTGSNGHAHGGRLPPARGRAGAGRPSRGPLRGVDLPPRYPRRTART